MKIIDEIIIDQNFLRQKSERTSLNEIKTMQLVKRLRKANKTAWTKGAGLAAIQIGIPLRFAWFIVNGKEKYLLNPEIIKQENFNIYKNEGCLSIPNQYTNTGRYYYIEYTTGGLKRKASNFEAILIQHEIDHMNGILNIDRKWDKINH